MIDSRSQLVRRGSTLKARANLETDESAGSHREVTVCNLSLLPDTSTWSPERKDFNYSSLSEVIGDMASSWVMEQGLLLKTSTAHKTGDPAPKKSKWRPFPWGSVFWGSLYTDSSCLLLKCPLTRRLGESIFPSTVSICHFRDDLCTFYFFRSFKKNWKSFTDGGMIPY